MNGKIFYKERHDQWESRLKKSNPRKYAKYIEKCQKVEDRMEEERNRFAEKTYLVNGIEVKVIIDKMNNKIIGRIINYKDD